MTLMMTMFEMKDNINIEKSNIHYRRRNFKKFKWDHNNESPLPVVSLLTLQNTYPFHFYFHFRFSILFRFSANRFFGTRCIGSEKFIRLVTDLSSSYLLI